jgi:hypothetical protein
MILEYRGMCNEISRNMLDYCGFLFIDRPDLTEKYIEDVERLLRSLDDKLFDAKVKFYQIKNKVIR